MPISREESIAEDSTCSLSSPELRPTTRVHRTYGRPKVIEPVTSHCDTSLTLSQTSLSSSQSSIFNTGPPDAHDEVPPTPDGKNDDYDKNAIYSKYRRDWRQDLAAIDAQFSDCDASFESSERPNASSDPPEVTLDALMSAKQGNSGVQTAPGSPSGGDTSKDIFGETCATIGSSRQTIRPSPTPSPVHTAEPRRSNKRANRIIDSDSEPDEQGGRSSLRSTPPRPLTSDPAFAYTPPTSEVDDIGSTRKAQPAAETSRANSLTRESECIPSESAKVSSSARPSERRSGKRPDIKKHKVKPPTKKERRQTMVEGVRLAVGRTVEVPHMTARHFTITSFFDEVKKGAPRLSKQQSLPSSDPIGTFSSPVGQTMRPTTIRKSSASPKAAETWMQSREASNSPTPSARARPLGAEGSIPILASDDDDLPEAAEIFGKRKEEDSKQAALRAKKLQLMQQQEVAQRIDEDSDDDLVIVDSNQASLDMHLVAQEEADDRRAQRQRHERPSLGRKMVKQFGVVHRATKATRDLNLRLQQQIEERKMEHVKRKEEDWVQRGGKIKTTVNTGDIRAIPELVEQYVERGLQAANEQGDDEEADSDGDWAPDENLRGSASPEPDKAYVSGSDGEDEPEVDEDITMVADEAEGLPISQEADEEEYMLPRGGKSRRLRVVAANSDSENEDNDKENTNSTTKLGPLLGRTFGSPIGEMDTAPIPPLGMPSITHRGSISSLDDRTEDDTDKENNTRLMFDKSEDKENKAVVRHLPVTRSPLFGLRRTGLGEALSPAARNQASEPSNAGSSDQRTPFKELRTDEDDPFVSPAATSPFAARLLKASTSLAALDFSQTPGPSLAPRFGGEKATAALEFSQFDGGDENDESAVSVFQATSLEPGFSQLFEAGTAKPSSSDAKGKGKETSDVLDRLRAPADLSDVPLTLDAGSLQPALEVSDNARRQADEIFEEEQAYLIEAAQPKPNRKPQLYVNDHGFLTQTRPDVHSPLVYHSQPFKAPTPRGGLSHFPSWLASQTPGGTQEVPQTDRRPLSTLSFSATPGDEDLDLENGSPRRLQRLRRPQASPNQSPSNRAKNPTVGLNKNAFAVLTRGAQHEHERTKRRLEKNAFVEAEAEESDDDEMLGFGFVRRAEDEEEADGEDLDRTLETLVDDAEMDVETEAKDKVMEKFQEHQEAEDQELEKLAKDATEGRLRLKRRNGGVGFDDSEDEEDDEEARRLRAKRQRTERDKIKELDTRETQAFHDVYAKDLEDENTEFAHLVHGDSQTTVVGGDDSQDKAYDESEDEHSENEKEYVNTSDIHHQIRELAGQNQDMDTIDPYDVNWLDEEGGNDVGDARVDIKEVLRQKPSVAPRQNVLLDWDFDSPESQLENSQDGVTGMDEQERARMEGWARKELRSGRLGTTGRSAVGAAITGHATKTLAGNKSVAKGRLAPGKAGAVAAASRPSGKGGKQGIKASRSILSAVDRSARFK